MIGNEDNKITYRVQFRTLNDVLTDNPRRTEARVDLFPGFTSLGDIPKIIAAASTGLAVEDVIVVSIDLVGLVVDGMRR